MRHWKRLIRRYLAAAAAAPLCLACDDLPLVEDADAEVHTSPDAAASDVLVVHFEVSPVPEAGPSQGALNHQAATETGRPHGPPQVQPTVTPAATEPTTAPIRPDPSLRWLVLDGRLVLAQGDLADIAWASDDDAATLSLPSDPDSGVFRAERALVTERLPSTITQLAGAEVKVFDHAREVCVARIAPIDTFRLGAELVHTTDVWDDEGEPIAPIHTADEVFEHGLRVLSAELEPLFGDCTRGLWAAPLEAPSPTLFREAANTRSFKRQALAAFRALPAWHAAQARMLETWDHDPQSPEARALRRERWDTLRGTTPEVTRYLSHDGATEIAVVHANSSDGCGSEGQSVVTVFEVQRDGRGRRFVERASLEWIAPPEGFVDLEGDGAIEIFVETRAPGTFIERWHREAAPPSEDNAWRDERREPVMSLEVPDLTMYGCGC